LPLACPHLRKFIDPQEAALITLFALGLGAKDCARLTIGDVDATGGSVATNRAAIAIPEPARACLRAQRLMRQWAGGANSDPSLAEHGRGLTHRQIKTHLGNALQQLGFELNIASFDDRIWPSQRWLFERGLAVHRTHAADKIERADALYGRAPKPRCRHRLPNWIAVGERQLTHSHRLCASIEPTDARPPQGGYVVHAVEATEQVQLWAVSEYGQPAGHLWSVETECGLVWLQSMEPQLPPMDGIETALRQMQSGK
jgi:hypothetical protein